MLIDKNSEGGETLTLRAAREGLSYWIKQLIENPDRQPITITRNTVPAVVIMSVEMFESMKAKIEIIDDPDMLEALTLATKAVKKRELGLAK